MGVAFPRRAAPSDGEPPDRGAASRAAVLVPRVEPPREPRVVGWPGAAARRRQAAAGVRQDEAAVRQAAAALCDRLRLPARQDEAAARQDEAAARPAGAAAALRVPAPARARPQPPAAVRARAAAPLPRPVRRRDRAARLPRPVRPAAARERPALTPRRAARVGVPRPVAVSLPAAGRQVAVGCEPGRAPAGRAGPRGPWAPRWAAPRARPQPPRAASRSALAGSSSRAAAAAAPGPRASAARASWRRLASWDYHPCGPASRRTCRRRAARCRADGPFAPRTAGHDLLDGARRALHLDPVIALEQSHHFLAGRVEQFRDFVDPNSGQRLPRNPCYWPWVSRSSPSTGVSPPGSASASAPACAAGSSAPASAAGPSAPASSAGPSAWAPRPRLRPAPPLRLPPRPTPPPRLRPRPAPP